MKISVIGIGKVGSTVAFVLARDGLADELVLYNRTRAVAHADAIDIQQAVAFVPHRVMVRDGSIEDTAGSDVLVICCGVKIPLDAPDRSGVAAGTTQIMCELVPQLVQFSPNAILINVANPMDVVTYHLLKLSKFPWTRVIGTGTLIDSARFRELLSEQVGIHPVDLKAYILGEHGESQFAALSIATSGGELIDATPARLKMLEEAKASAWEVYRSKGYTNYAVAMAVQMIVQSIHGNLGFTMPVSVLIDDFCGVSDVCVSVPCVINRRGVHLRLRPALDQREQELFRRSAGAVRKVVDATQPIIARYC